MNDRFFWITVIYLIIINLTALILMGIDKLKAVKRDWRIPEKTLVIPTLIGGALGGIIGMLVFRHKIRKPKFYILFPLFLCIQIFLLIYFGFFAKLFSIT